MRPTQTNRKLLISAKSNADDDFNRAKSEFSRLSEGEKKSLPQTGSGQTANQIISCYASRSDEITRAIEWLNLAHPD